MSEVIRVGIADMNTCEAPDKITTIGLGSCVGIVLYERTKSVAGLVHIMLPDSTKIRQNQNKLKFADTGIAMLVEELEKKGLVREKMLAKIAGGAKMFQFSSNYIVGNIGEKNVEAVREVLKQYQIRLVSEDVGLNYGRTIIFDPETKDLTVVKAGKQTRII
ncbi:MAG: chemotaxis protein CheD [Wujia sp.]